LEFKKLISKHIKLQERHGNLLCSHKKIMDSCALLESAHEVMLAMVKSSQPHTCTCAPYFYIILSKVYQFLEGAQATKILSSKSRLYLLKILSISILKIFISKIPIQSVGPRFLEERRILMIVQIKISSSDNFST
jgi:hypothetical protein